MNEQFGRPAGQGQSSLSRLLVLAFGLLISIGFVWSQSGEQLLAYLLVVVAAMLPTVLWVRLGASGIPVLPVVVLAYIPYFGWPILSSDDVAQAYTTWEILRAALTVTLFLSVASFSWFLMLRGARSKPDVVLAEFENERVVRLVLFGMWFGVLFNLATLSDLLNLGPFFGVARAVAGTLAMVACFLSGVTRAQGVLRGNAWAGAIAGLLLLVLVSWSGLFLVTGIIYMLAMLFGYCIVAKRVPWVVIGVAFVVVTVLHAGKPELRAKYWDSASAGYSVWNAPGLMLEWFAEGVTAITTNEEYQSPLERAGLMHMLLFAQTRTPESVDFLYGATYQLLPSILVPRFIDASKPISGAGMELINLHYGIFSDQVDAFTSIGWGLVAEAYANYGYLCVIAVAVLLGVLTGFLHQKSVGAAVISMPTLLSIAVMMALINVEADFIQICSTILQSFAAVLIFHTGFKSFALSRDPPGRTGAA